MDGLPTGLYAAGYRQIWRVASDGFAVRVWQKIVPRIHDQITECGIYLYHSVEHAEAGDPYGASGFLVGLPFKDTPPNTWSHCYAVTNAHVIDGGCLVVRVNINHPKASTMAIPLTKEDWIYHPDGDDIAIASISLDKYIHRFQFISPVSVSDGSFFVSKEFHDKFALGIGDEAFMIGRFMARDESGGNAPIARFGHIASSKIETIRQGGRADFPQESYLVEVHSISGFSGSPVFVSLPTIRVNPIPAPDLQKMPLDSIFRNLARALDHRIYLLGVDWGHLDEAQFPGMAGVVPAWKLTELLNCPKVLEMQNEEEKRIAKETKHSAKLDVRGKSQRSKAGIEIPIPSKGEVMDVFKKATRKRDKKPL